MTREDLSTMFQTSAQLGRATDDLAKEKAKTVILTRLITEAADHLSNCLIQVDGRTVRIMETRVLKSANALCRALMIAGVELPPIDLADAAQLIEASQIGGEHDRSA